METMIIYLKLRSTWLDPLKRWFRRQRD